MNMELRNQLLNEISRQVARYRDLSARFVNLHEGAIYWQSQANQAITKAFNAEQKLTNVMKAHQDTERKLAAAIKSAEQGWAKYHKEAREHYQTKTRVRWEISDAVARQAQERNMQLRADNSAYIERLQAKIDFLEEAHAEQCHKRRDLEVSLALAMGQSIPVQERG